MNDMFRLYRRKCYFFGAEVIMVILVLFASILLVLEYIETGRQELFVKMSLGVAAFSFNLLAIKDNLKEQRDIERYLTMWRYRDD